MKKDGARVKIQTAIYRRENMNGKIRILGFAGSLRKGSFKKSLLRAAMEKVPTRGTGDLRPGRAASVQRG